MEAGSDRCAATGNNTGLLSDITPVNRRSILNIAGRLSIVAGMKTASFITVLALGAGLGLPASAACYADYKARRDNPLELHYGVAQISGACTKANAQAQLSPRLGQDGWRLLNVLQVFDDSGLASRKQAAGRFFLRY